MGRPIEEDVDENSEDLEEVHWEEWYIDIGGEA